MSVRTRGCSRGSNPSLLVDVANGLTSGVAEASPRPPSSSVASVQRRGSDLRLAARVAPRVVSTIGALTPKGHLMARLCSIFAVLALVVLVPLADAQTPQQP